MNLIPFGKHKETQRLVDVAEVAKGANCACICPGCGIPLIARQGNKREWHFAHNKSYQEDKTGVCKYSWFVALRMMIRQILRDGHDLLLPEYTTYHPLQRKHITITKSHKTRYENCSTDVTVKGESHSFDARLQVKGHPLLVFVSYKGREYRGQHHGEEVDGILEIDLRNLHLIRQKSLTEASCVTQLCNMLKFPHACKQWRYHRREVAIKEKIKGHLKEQKKQRAYERAQRRRHKTSDQPQYAAPEQTPRKPIIAESYGNAASKSVARGKGSKPEEREFDAVLKTHAPISPKTVSRKASPEPVKDKPFYCIMCKLVYMGTATGRNPCPKCNEHLYRREL